MIKVACTSLPCHTDYNIQFRCISIQLKLILIVDSLC